MSVIQAHAPIVLEAGSTPRATAPHTRSTTADRTYGEILEDASPFVVPARAPFGRPRLRAMSPVGMPDTDAGDGDGDLGDVGELLRRLDSWPYLRIERRTRCVTLRVRDLVIGTLSLETHSVSVNVPPDSVGLLLESRPQLRATEHGASVHVSDRHSREAAEALLRWRIELERFAGQLGAASP